MSIEHEKNLRGRKDRHKRGPRGRRRQNTLSAQADWTPNTLTRTTMIFFFSFKLHKPNSI